MPDPLKKVSKCAEREQQRAIIYCLQNEHRMLVEVCLHMGCSCSRLTEYLEKEGEDESNR